MQFIKVKLLLGLMVLIMTNISQAKIICVQYPNFYSYIKFGKIERLINHNFKAYKKDITIKFSKSCHKTDVNIESANKIDHKRGEYLIENGQSIIRIYEPLENSQYYNDNKSFSKIFFHEMGHYLGLSHNQDMDSMMNAEYFKLNRNTFSKEDIQKIP